MTYTPTTDEVRDAATQCPDGIPDAEFDRWLKAHHAEVAAQALREAASAPIPRAALNTRNNGLRQWLRARADQIELGHSQDSQRCTICGTDLRYPTAVHIVDCTGGTGRIERGEG